jgi:hypothetical protein
MTLLQDMNLLYSSLLSHFGSLSRTIHFYVSSHMPSEMKHNLGLNRRMLQDMAQDWNIRHPVKMTYKILFMAVFCPHNICKPSLVITIYAPKETADAWQKTCSRR